MNVSRPSNIVKDSETIPEPNPENDLYKEILMILKNSY